MLISLILALLLGILIGTFTGLSPGIHVNLIAAILLSSLSYFSGIPVLALAVFIVSLSITHTFIDFIPSILLGAPEEDSFLAILPGHELLLAGRGYEAIILTLFGSIIGIVIITLTTPLYLLFLPKIYLVVKSIIPYLLILLSFYLIFRERNFLLSLLVFTLSGLIGLFAFNLPLNEPLLPLLTGLFGVSSILNSLKNKHKIKKQVINKISSFSPSKKEILSSSLSAFLSAPLCSFLPGIGSGHAATISSEIIPQTNRTFLILIGAINTIVMGLSFIALYSISRVRSGSASAIKELLGAISPSDLLIILFSIILTGIIATFLTISIAKLSIKFINTINYGILSVLILLFLSILVLFFSGLIGILILISSSSIGLFCILSGSRRINLMGALIIPTILYYLMY